MNDPDRRQTSDGFDHDAMFADIVAHWSDVAGEPAPVEGPSLESASDDAVDHDAVADDEAARQPPPHQHFTTAHFPTDHFPTDATPVQPTPSEPRAIPAPQAWRAHDVDSEYEEHFEPPPTAPLPAGDLQFWAILAGMVGGPLLLLYLVLFNREAGSFWMLAAIAMSVGGFALLVSRLPRDHQDDDDGARL